jgi:gliding motility associated protien GldN
MKKLLFLVVALLLAGDLMAQSQQIEVIDGAYKRQQFKKRPPIPQAYIRESDVMFSWNILRVIDLNQKPNLVFTYPKSMLINTLIDAVKSGELEGYLYKTEELKPENAVTSDDIIKTLETFDTVLVTNPVTLLPEQRIEKTEFNPNDVVKYRIKEEWVFDKQISTMVVRIIAIAPVQNLKSEGQVVGELPMFWVYYPAIRNIISATEVFNWRNDGQKTSFDDVFIRRQFASYIYKESNVKDLRIEDYAAGKDILKEADRIKYKLTDFEQALWEY